LSGDRLPIFSTDHHTMNRSHRGNAAIVIVLVLGTVLAVGIAVMFAVRGSAIETRRQNADVTPTQLDSMLQPVATWAAMGITKWSGEHDGSLPTNDEGKAIIAGLGAPPAIEQASGFSATPVYRRMGEDIFEIVIATAELDGSAHLVYPFTAKGRLLAPVADNIFLNEDEQETDALEATPGADTTPR
jgi:hypothetical protein